MRTVGDVVTWWLSRIEADRTKSVSYQRSMRSLMRKHVIPAIGKVRIGKVTRVLMDDQLVFPLHEVLKPRTIQKALQGLGQAFRMAERQGRIDANPLAGTTFRDFYKGKLPPKPAQLSRIDLPHLVELLVRAFTDDPAKAMLPLMMLAHGTRITETLLAEWGHVSLDQRMWVIPASNTKSKREHLLPVTPQALALLQRYREALPSARKATWMFAVRGGGPMSPSSGHALLRGISKRAWTSHDLRKLMRDSLSDIGIDHAVAERLLNHSLGVTVETYLTRDDLARRREALERWHARLDELGFADAHGAKMAVPAFLQNPASPVATGHTAESCISTGRG